MKIRETITRQVNCHLNVFTYQDFHICYLIRTGAAEQVSIVILCRLFISD